MHHENFFDLSRGAKDFVKISFSVFDLFVQFQRWLHEENRGVTLVISACTFCFSDSILVCVLLIEGVGVGVGVGVAVAVAVAVGNRDTHTHTLKPPSRSFRSRDLVDAERLE